MRDPAVTLRNIISAVIKASDADIPDIMTALTMVTYDATLATALVSGREPSTALAHFIQTLEAHWGEFLLHPETTLKIKLANAVLGRAK